MGSSVKQVVRRGFQKAAAPHAAAQLYSWGARALYLGPALNLSAHRNAVACVALGLDATFGVANDPDDAAAGYRRCRSVLIPPNTLHHLAGMRGTMAFLYVDACSLDLQRLQQAASTITTRAAFDSSIEADLLELLRALRSQHTAWPAVRRELSRFLGAEVDIDARVRTVLDLLHADIGAKPGLARLASQVHLSESRLRRLFKAATGVPLSRYRLWIAMSAAMRRIAAGETLTAAALDTGFASSAHFSAAYREMFGLEPSRMKQQLRWSRD